MKKCRVCLQDQEETEFAKKRYNKAGELVRATICRSCQKKASNAWYKLNQSRVREVKNLRNQKARDLFRELKKRPCADCEQSFPACCMDFDHLPGNQKKFDIAQRKHSLSPAVKQEISKCDLVCANCHRIRTYIRRWGKDPRTF